jgi:hypothetical protein
MNTDPTWQAAVDVCRKVFEFDAMPQTPEELERALERYAGVSIHSCSHLCQRPTCVIRRERDEFMERCIKLVHYVKTCRAGDSPLIHAALVESLDLEVEKTEQLLQNQENKHGNNQH